VLEGFRSLFKPTKPFNEGEAVWQALKGLRRGTMIDVGAHHGTSHEPYLRKGWRVYAFEPDNANRAVIKPHPNLIVSSAAVGSEEIERASFYTSGESSGISSLSAFTPSHHRSDFVTVTTLSKFIQEHGVTSCDFMKIDAEGHDLFVLKGFPWEKLIPQVVMCEFEDRKTLPLGYSYRDMGDFLRDRGYRVFMSEWAPIVRYGMRHTWLRVVSYPAETLEPEAWGNFLAFRPSVRVPRLLESHMSETVRSPL
jgi:FkbM family methyltransferase